MVFDISELLHTIYLLYTKLRWRYKHIHYEKESDSPETMMSRFLLHYHSIPHSTTGVPSIETTQIVSLPPHPGIFDTSQTIITEEKYDFSSKKES